MAERETRRDLTAGIALDELAQAGMIAGRVGEDDVLLVKTGSGIVAVGARCTHNGASLADGLVVGETVRCPWHHACFDLRSGAAIAAPALQPLGRWSVIETDGRVSVGAPQLAPPHPAAPAGGRIVIIGAGAAGAAAADALCALGQGAAVTLIGNEPEGPYDRTMLTKHYLSGQAGDGDLPLRTANLAAHGVTLRLGAVATAIEPEGRTVRLADGTTLPFDKLILATGAEPKRLTVPGAEMSHVRVLRSAADARGILSALDSKPRVVVVGASFIGLEAAAALRDRDIDVTVVAPDEHPFAGTFGAELSGAILKAHRKHGTALRLGRRITRIEPGSVTLDDGATLPADLVIVGIGVTPRTALAEAAGLEVVDGVVVDERLRTSHRDIYAVGDIARWPDPHSGAAIRVEHWAVAQRQGQIAAANALGRALRYDAVPFFWTLHFDYSVRYVGHAGTVVATEVEGDPAENAVVRIRGEGRDEAVATVERDMAGLEAEVAMERRLGGPAATLPVQGGAGRLDRQVSEPDRAAPATQTAPDCSSL